MNRHFPLTPGSRREFLRRAACGFGSVALEGLLAAENCINSFPFSENRLCLCLRCEYHKDCKGK